MHRAVAHISLLLAISLASGCGKKDSSVATQGEAETTPKNSTEPQVAKNIPVPETERTKLAGVWQGTLALEGDDMEPQSVPFTMKLSKADSEPSVVFSGDTEVPITSVSVQDGEVSLQFVPYHTKIVARVDGAQGTMEGAWSLPWVDGSLDFAFNAKRSAEGERATIPDESPSLDKAAIAALPSVGGLWEVSFPQPDGADKLCAARFEQEGSGVKGTFVAPTGDYGYLTGEFQDGKLRLFNFDGAFAYVVSADAQADGTLVGAGQFNLFRQEFSARPSKEGTLDSELPQCAELTKWSGKRTPLSLTFTGLDGKSVALADLGLEGKVVLLDLFGTWCPNCHQLIPLLTELHKKYQATGLEIIGVGFEFADGREAVSAYRDKHAIPYRMLVGAAPQDAPNVMPQVPLTSYPTLVLIGRDGKVHNIQTGFRGTATGEFRKADAARFEARIQKLLAQGSK